MKRLAIATFPLLLVGGFAEPTVAETYNDDVIAGPGFVERQVRTRGYNKLRWISNAYPYVIEACRRDVRYKLTLNRRAKIKGRISLGPCHLTRAQLRDNLNEKGFTRIKFVESSPHNHTMRACRENSLYQFDMNSEGDISGSRKIGRCRSAAFADSDASDRNPELHRALAQRGYRQITIRDNTPPKFVAEACKSRKKFVLTLNRSNSIVDRVDIGRCDDFAENEWKDDKDIENSQIDDNTQFRELTRKSVRKFLQQSNFRSIRILKRSSDKATAEACRKSDLYRVTISSTYDNRNASGSDYEITRQRYVGTCPHKRHAANPASGKIIAELSNLGFESIEIDNADNPLKGIRACRNGRQVVMTMNRQFRVKSTRDLGACQSAFEDRLLSATELYNILLHRGFTNVNIIDGSPPKYVAEACRKDVRFQLTLNARTEITDRRRRGPCTDEARGIASDHDVRRVLQDRGYEQIVIVDQSRLGFVVNACRHQDRFRMTVDRNGEVADRRRRGRCSSSGLAGYNSTKADIRRTLSAKGYFPVKFLNSRDGYHNVRTCRNGIRFELRMSRSGEIESRRRSGWCNPIADARYTVLEPRPVRERELERDGSLSPQKCQDYLNWIIHKNTILFDVASADIRKENFRSLRRMARVAKRCPDTIIEIAGHTDSDGTFENNLQLSEQRAESVRFFLMDQGVDPNRLVATGYGEERPILPNSNRENKEQNRRIDFVLLWEGA